MTIAVVLLTYGRLDYAKRTLSSAMEGLSSSQGLVWHIASDGDSLRYINSLASLAAKNHDVVVTVSNSERGGYGKNYNLAMQTAHQLADYVIPLEDDWELLRPLDLDPLIADIATLGLGCVRLGYLGFTQEVRGSLAAGQSGTWLKLDENSPEPHVFAGHPRIETVKWSRRVGPWPEGLLPGETEFTVSKREQARRDVGWPLDVVHPRGDLFAHIGTKRSY